MGIVKILILLKEIIPVFFQIKKILKDETPDRVKPLIEDGLEVMDRKSKGPKRFKRKTPIARVRR